MVALSHKNTIQCSSQSLEVASPIQAAQDAGLRYVTDTSPGLQRKRVGKHFRYLDVHGQLIQDKKVLERIHSLGIPPAWQEVWICPSPHGHVQATGRDAKGRKQYRYHTHWRKIRDETKYERMSAFGKALPHIREQVAHDLALPGLSREKVLATIIRLLDITAIRIGNEEYARENQSYGVTTMKDQHVAVGSTTLHFHFRGKSGKEHNIDVHDRQLAKIVKQCRDLPGQELFQYVDEQNIQHVVTSDDVNNYLHEISDFAFTAKDFRTWAGTVAATCALLDFGEFESQTQAKKNVVHAIGAAAQQLGNTPAICRKSYVHPEIIDAYLSGELSTAVQQNNKQAVAEALYGLRPDELAVLALLNQ